MKIGKFNNNDITFDKNTGYFVCKEFRDGDYRRLLESLERDSQTDFTGEFYLSSSFDGIVKFTARKKIWDKYEDKWMVIGKSDKTGGSNSVPLDDLYPINEHNTALLEKGKKMDSDGWKLIWGAKSLSKELIKD